MRRGGGMRILCGNMVSNRMAVGWGRWSLKEGRGCRLDGICWRVVDRVNWW